MTEITVKDAFEAPVFIHGRLIFEDLNKSLSFKFLKD
jgi:hypothetical protein